MQKHTLKGLAVSRQVWLNGQLLDPAESQKVHNHSPDGFNWGYGGSGPAQLALAIALRLNGHVLGYQTLKWEYIAVLPQNEDFEITFEFHNIKTVIPS